MALLLALAMLPAGAIAMQVGVNAVNIRQAAYEEALGRRALQSIAAERSVVDEVREMMRVLATAPSLHQIEAGDCRQWLGEVAVRYPYVVSISVTDETGTVRCSVPYARPGFRAPRSDLRERARARDAFTIGYVERGAISQRAVLAALEPIRQGDRRIGFIGASIGIDELRRLISGGRALRDARAAIVDFTGRVVVQSELNDATRSIGLPSPEQIRNRLGPDPAFIAVNNGSAVVVPLHAPDLYAVMSWAPDQPAWRRWSELAFSVAAPILIWLLAIGAGWFAIEVFVARPLSNLESAARGFARGEEVDEPPALRNAPDEIRSLRRTLAAMAKTLRGREQRLVEALGEERALLREVHHRVKNNLQMVASLLNIQARAARDDSEARGLARAHERVQLLALVHQRIYASGAVRELRLDELVTEIARQLVHARNSHAREIKLVLDVAEARADVDHAVPLAFLIGEAISSALDQLSASGPVDLRICLRQDPDGEARFAIDSEADAAAEAPPGPSARLIDGFARQLGATLARDPQRPFRLWVWLPAAGAAG